MNETPDRTDGPAEIPPHRGKYAFPASGAGASNPPAFHGAGEVTPDPPDRTGAALRTTTALLAVGGWLLLAPFALAYTSAVPTANDLVAGSVLVVVALAGLVAPRDMRWLGLVSAAVGAWVVVAPFVLFYTARAPDAADAVWNDLLAGAAAVVLGVRAWLLQRHP